MAETVPLGGALRVHLIGIVKRVRNSLWGNEVLESLPPIAWRHWLIKWETDT